MYEVKWSHLSAVWLILCLTAWCIHVHTFLILLISQSFHIPNIFPKKFNFIFGRHFGDFGNLVILIRYVSVFIRTFISGNEYFCTFSYRAESVHIGDLNSCLPDQKLGDPTKELASLLQVLLYTVNKDDCRWHRTVIVLFNLLFMWSVCFNIY